MRMLIQLVVLLGMAAAYLAGANAQDPLAAPIYGDLDGLPPLLVQVGTAETLLDDARRLDMPPARRLRVVETLRRLADVVDAVTHRRHAVDAEAEGEPLPGLRIDAAVGQHVGMDHAAAAELEPRTVLA